MDIEKYFGNNYADAHELFLSACNTRNLEVKEYKHPLSGSNEVTLSTDVAYLGSDKPKKLLILTSGVHGPELMCGSGCQVGAINERYFEHMRNDMGVLIVHAVNPWGAFTLSRNTEDNIDLARNFVDFSLPLPENNAYAEIHQVFKEKTYAAYKKARDILISKYGKGKFVSALMGGQYQYSDGFGYGGNQPGWSNNLFCELLKKYTAHTNIVCHIDYHTAIGPYGYGMAVSMQSGEDLALAKNWFGEWVVTPNMIQSENQDDSYNVSGHPSNAVRRISPSNVAISIVLEFGTYATFDNNIITMMNDFWLTQHDDIDSENGKKSKAEMLRAHFAEDPDWRCAVWTRSKQVLTQAMRGLRAN